MDPAPQSLAVVGRRLRGRDHSGNASPRRTRIRYIACVALLAVGTLGPLITYFLVSPARIGRTPAAGEPSASIEIARDSISTNEPDVRQWTNGSPANRGLRRSASPNETPQTLTITQPDSEPAWLQWHDSLRRWLPTLVAGWFIGVVLLSIRLGATWRGVQRLLKENAKPISGPLREAADRICRCLRVPTVRLLESVELQVPIAVGWLRPVVLIPTSVIVGLPPAQVEALLAHELAHLCRRDYLVNLVQSVVEILFFYHPAVWWLSRTIRCEREQACDDLTVSVVKDSVLYARALTRLASNHIEHPRTAVAASGGHLFRRIERLVSPTTARSPHAPNSAWVVCLLIAGLAIAVAGTPGLIAQMQARSTTKEHTSDEARPAEQASDSRRSSQPNAAVLFGTTSPGADWIETPVVEGTVVDVDGRPVDSADVFLRLRSGATDGTTGEPVFSAPVAKVATVGGRFHFPATRVPNPEKRFGSPYGFDVIAAHKGNAIGWWHILDPGPIKIKLRPEFVLQGAWPAAAIRWHKQPSLSSAW